MTWIALADHEERRFSLRGIGGDKQAEPICSDDPDQMLPRGSVMVETRLSDDGRPHVLFGYNHAYPEQRSLMFQAIPGGGIAMVQVQGSKIAHAAVQRSNDGRADVLRITFSWDAPRNWGQLTVELPEDHRVVSVPVAGAMPMCLSDLHDMMLGHGDQTLSADVVFAALSDQVEPIGPMPTLHPATPLATPWGYKPARQLGRGDTVMTHGGDVVPVLHNVARTVPARGSFAPVRLRAPYFGLQQDIIVNPDQRLMIDGPEVEYLFNQEAVLVPARHLVNGFAARAEPCGPTVTYTQVLLPAHDTIHAAGTLAESLYIGRIRRNAANLETSLLNGLDRSSLPEHGRAAYQVLRWFEAIHLARQRAA